MYLCGEYLMNFFHMQNDTIGHGDKTSASSQETAPEKGQKNPNAAFPLRQETFPTARAARDDRIWSAMLLAALCLLSPTCYSWAVTHEAVISVTCSAPPERKGLLLAGLCYSYSNKRLYSWSMAPLTSPWWYPGVLNASRWVHDHWAAPVWPA